MCGEHKSPTKAAPKQPGNPQLTHLYNTLCETSLCNSRAITFLRSKTMRISRLQKDAYSLAMLALLPLQQTRVAPATEKHAMRAQRNGTTSAFPFQRPFSLSGGQLPGGATVREEVSSTVPRARRRSDVAKESQRDDSDHMRVRSALSQHN